MVVARQQSVPTRKQAKHRRNDHGCTRPETSRETWAQGDFSPTVILVSFGGGVLARKAPGGPPEGVLRASTRRLVVSQGNE